jgi:hypothetical protein
MTTLFKLLPDHNVILALNHEELAGLGLELILDRCSAYIDFETFISPSMIGQFSNQHYSAITNALLKSWNWLINVGIIEPVGVNKMYVVTQLGLELQDRIGTTNYQLALFNNQTLANSI